MLWSLPTQITSWLANLSKPWTSCSMLRTVLLSLTFFRCPVHAVFKPRVHHYSLCDCYGSGSIPQATFYSFAHLCVWNHYSCTYLSPTSCLSTCCKELSTNLPEQLFPYQPHYLLLTTTSLLIFLLTGNQPYRVRREVTTLFSSKFTWTSPSHGERRDTVLRAVC